MVQERKGEYRKELEEWASQGFIRARVDGEIRRLDEDFQQKMWKVPKEGDYMCSFGVYRSASYTGVSYGLHVCNI